MRIIEARRTGSPQPRCDIAMISSIRRLYAPRTSGFGWYVLAAAVLGFVGSLALVLAAFAVSGGLQDDPDGPAVRLGWTSFLGVVVLAPLVETAALLAILWLLRSSGAGPGASALLSALVWGGLHALAFPMWFFGTVWSFFVFSSAAIAWWDKSSKHAFWAAALPHALINGLVFLGVALAER